MESSPSKMSSSVLSSLADFLEDNLPKEGGGDCKTCGIKEVFDHIQSTKIPRSEWERFAFFSKASYTRNLVVSGTNFDMIVLCWNKGQASAAHDHGGSNCWMKCLHGNMRENLYKNEEGKPLEILKKTDLTEGGLAYIHDSIGLHKVENLDSDDVAVSLHIYSPPINKCKKFSTKTGAAFEAGMQFYSKQGELCERGMDS
eukprot:CAMPEP_0113882496 /NCGR_PEP_ID=MMETSP0780_2-20120614/8995_1 /TAXON_ID=652834 /ORGANISM="Palpitomonas bilix" /LENGTH=199 /DNA_ID=CAMNT_0000869533 /DNA_START=114 /DNA_END=713 /DNA_ORIENTATION=- /assembly_acc=CAM_ASM_000599